MWQSEQLLTREVRLVFAVMHRELFFEVLKFVEGFARRKTDLHRAVFLKVLAEHFHFDYEGSDVLNQLLFKYSLFFVKTVSNFESLLDQLLPLLLEVLALVQLVTV